MGRRVICVMGRPLDQDDGIGVYTSQLLRNLLALDPKSRYVILLRTTKHRHMFDEFPNAETRVLPARTKSWWDQVVVPAAARRVKADIIFNPKFSLPLVAGRPGVFVLHGSDWYVNPGNYSWWDNLYIRLMLPIYCAKAAKLLSISKRALEDTVKYAHIDGSKVTLSFAAAGPHFTVVTDQAVLREFAERYQLPPRFILTVARAYHTGHGRLPEYPGGNNETLLRGYRKYREAGGALPLVVVGRDIERYLRGHGFDDRALEGVRFTGFVPNLEIVKAYNLAEFFILATLYESFPLPLIEALSTGCPAIVPITGGCRDLAEDAARYIDPLNPDSIAEAMTALATSPELRQRMRAAGLERAKEFTWRKTAERTLTVLDSIAAP
ncbi:MAG TPA: glycosyltransferase family 1 protein [Gemmatimonadales bacterium]|nr:glycosyltransferase family 1 protein [Gemmatimonadales bacterium]